MAVQFRRARKRFSVHSYRLKVFACWRGSIIRMSGGLQWASLECRIALLLPVIHTLSRLLFRAGGCCVHFHRRRSAQSSAPFGFLTENNRSSWCPTVHCSSSALRDSPDLRSMFTRKIRNMNWCWRPWTSKGLIDSTYWSILIIECHSKLFCSLKASFFLFLTSERNHLYSVFTHYPVWQGLKFHFLPRSVSNFQTFQYLQFLEIWLSLLSMVKEIINICLDARNVGTLLAL